MLKERKESIPEFQDQPKLRTRRKSTFYNYKPILLCLLNPDSDKPSKIIPAD